jgi:Fur family ferric uptake transcriptional regulator
MVLQQAEDLLHDYLIAREQKLTWQRRAILAIFFEAKTHLTIEELYGKVQERDRRIGVATVYRTVKLLCGCGLASGFRDTGGNVKYEFGKEYHEHLVCVKCGRVIEAIEAAYQLPANLCAAREFTVLHSRLEVYGICQECSNPHFSAGTT